MCAETNLIAGEKRSNHISVDFVKVVSNVGGEPVSLEQIEPFRETFGDVVCLPDIGDVRHILLHFIRIA